MSIRRALMMQQQSGLRAEYQRVEWIGCSGTQWIETNFVPNQNYDIYWTYMLTANQSGDKMMFGVTNINGILVYAEVYNTARFYCASGVSRFSNVLQESKADGKDLNVKYDAKMEDGVLTVGRSTASQTGTSGTTYGNKLFIFAWCGNNGAKDYVNPGLRLYKLLFAVSGTPAANFVPCIRKSDSKPGMYDTVSNTFYTNAGTGEFFIPT